MGTELTKVDYSLICQGGVFNPFNGDVIETATPNGLGRAHAMLKLLSSAVYTAQIAVRSELGKLINPSGAKTQCIRAEQITIKLEQPDDSWDQACLKAAWEQFPDLAPDYLRIESIKPQMREIKKLAETVGDERFMLFKDLVIGARKQSTSPPTVSIEE